MCSWEWGTASSSHLDHCGGFPAVCLHPLLLPIVFSPNILSMILLNHKLNDVVIPSHHTSNEIQSWPWPVRSCLPNSAPSFPSTCPFKYAALTKLACSSSNAYSLLPAQASHLLFLLPGTPIFSQVSLPHLIRVSTPNIASPWHVWSPSPKLLLCCWPLLSANHYLTSCNSLLLFVFLQTCKFHADRDVSFYSHVYPQPVQ